MITAENYTGAAILYLYPTVVRVSDDNIAYDADGNIVEYDPIIVQDEAGKLLCKRQAKELLSTTDWTTIPDVSDPAVSNPYLMNAGEFASYRSQIRALAVNPVANPVWPAPPTTQWSN